MKLYTVVVHNLQMCMKDFLTSECGIVEDRLGIIKNNSKIFIILLSYKWQTINSKKKLFSY
jgi:catalase (peroxidase I)